MTWVILSGVREHSLWGICLAVCFVGRNRDRLGSRAKEAIQMVVCHPSGSVDSTDPGSVQPLDCVATLGPFDAHEWGGLNNA